ncbi:MAG: NERD domain-containing protein [Anaerolineae bacterium]|nr:NERD domain-containing protein [Anaerolineae bacterium]
MILVDNRLTNLVRGYDRVRKADVHLRSEWRHHLLAAYARRRTVYDSARVRHRQQMAGFNPKVVIGLVVSSLVCLLGLVLESASVCSGFLLMAAGATSGGLLIIAWLWRAIISAPKRPQHPLHGDLKARLFPHLLPLWRQKLRGRLPAHKPYEGATGEHNFVRRLQRLGDDASYIIYRLQQRPGDDVDVAVVGPKGVWVFEVKYWSGRISYRHGRWSHVKSYYKAGGFLVTESKEVEQPPDRQWRRMAGDVAETLRRRAPNLVAALPVVAEIKGGLVFTHPDAAYDIARDCPCAWGDIAGWIRHLGNAPVIAGLSERVVLRILDVLLVRHQQVCEGGVLVSMDAYAAELVQKTEARLREWCEIR